MERVAIYLRKSRSDIEAETRGEGETLAKHKKTLLQVAKQQNLNIINIRQEIVSGESLLHRPEMMELLKEVETDKYDGVLVMDMDRLGRGNMKEQGLILETFRNSNTKIITPRKTYDLLDEWDEEYSEFEAFMARKELKIINRRLQGGRIRSVEEGNFIATRSPYGYKVQEDVNGRYLIPDEETAPIVKMMFEWYTNDDPHQRLSSSKIADLLNAQGIRTYEGKWWNGYLVRNIIKNAVYAGRLQWKKTQATQTRNNKLGSVLRPREDWIDVKGKHEAIISMETYRKTQDILKSRTHVPHKASNDISNPLAGLVKCENCGSSMILRTYSKQPPHIMCYRRKQCKNRSARFSHLENRIIFVLHQWLEQYQLKWDISDKPNSENHIIEIKISTLHNLNQELKNLESQKGRLHDLLERGIYDDSTYLDRFQHIANRIEGTQTLIQKTAKDLTLEQERQKAKKDIIPRVKHVLEIYNQLDDPAQKNSLLKSVLEKCTYRKEKHQRDDQFTLVIYPKI
ncbi:recombinase family protein [Shimazuella kribbensis]|uniref:recombinase family protein n=1 Tax=Shimazuella kribbensis TaxID=139808 RepID=UPI0003FE80E1|nr:recombinase family protein [Shimazuella kribbensis]